MRKSATDLFAALRTWRNTVAESLHREPYMVLQNAVLLEIATKQPATLDELKKIRGMGQAKLSQFGHDILAIVQGEIEVKHEPVPPQSPPGETVYSVGELLSSINHLLSFQQVIVQGEIGSIDRRGRYTFFTLLDPREEALINCFVWEDRLIAQGIDFAEGMTVQVAGHPGIYKRTGRFTFEVARISLIGEGALKIAFAKLKERLQILGYFDPEKKLPIPPFVRHIGLITSSYADARKDFLTHLGNFGFVIDFYHIRVEGLYAVDDITRALSFFNKQPGRVDIIVLTRGGGSLESMQPFNTEEVAQAIFSSRIPVVTGIGHENDLSIADLVADRYASTPTDAGRILSEDWRRLTETLESYEIYLTSRIQSLINSTRQTLSYLEGSITKQLQSEVASRSQYLSLLERTIAGALPGIFGRFPVAERDFIRTGQVFQTHLEMTAAKISTVHDLLHKESNRFLSRPAQILEAAELLLAAHDPQHRLKQGYSIVRNRHGNVVKSSRSLKRGDSLDILFGEGSAKTRVEKT